MKDQSVVFVQILHNLVEKLFGWFEVQLAFPVDRPNDLHNLGVVLLVSDWPFMSIDPEMLVKEHLGELLVADVLTEGFARAKHLEDFRVAQILEDVEQLTFA